MNLKKLLNIGTSLTVALTAVSTLGLSGNASALACYQYNPNGFQTSQTPVFNNICGITSTLSSTQGSYPLGDEPNFVRIRPNTSNSPLGADNPPLVNTLTAACTPGSKYDIWTYIHNDAEPQFNDNGNGSAVAHNVKLATTAPVNTTSSKFAFSSTVSASNAASVSDSASLVCNNESQPVELTLVPNSVHYNNNLAQTTFGSLSDNVVNSTTPIGSPVWAAANVWGCWEYRTVVVYQVEVQKVPTTPPTTPPSTPPTTPPSTPPTTPGTTSTPSSTPTQLVNTGPGSDAAVFAIATAAGIIGYRWYISRRLSRQ